MKGPLLRTKYHPRGQIHGVGSDTWCSFLQQLEDVIDEISGEFGISVKKSVITANKERRFVDKGIREDGLWYLYRAMLFSGQYRPKYMQYTLRGSSSKDRGAFIAIKVEGDSDLHVEVVRSEGRYSEYIETIFRKQCSGILY